MEMKTKTKKAGGELVMVSQRGKTCVVRRTDDERVKKDRNGKGKGKGSEEGDGDFEGDGKGEYYPDCDME